MGLQSRSCLPGTGRGASVFLTKQSPTVMVMEGEGGFSTRYCIQTLSQFCPVRRGYNLLTNLCLKVLHARF